MIKVNGSFELSGKESRVRDDKVKRQNVDTVKRQTDEIVLGMVNEQSIEKRNDSVRSGRELKMNQNKISVDQEGMFEQMDMDFQDESDWNKEELQMQRRQLSEKDSPFDVDGIPVPDLDEIEQQIIQQPDRNSSNQGVHRRQISSHQSTNPLNQSSSFNMRHPETEQKPLTQSEVMVLLETIKETLNHQPFQMVLSILYQKHVLKLPDSQIFTSQSLISQSKFIIDKIRDNLSADQAMVLPDIKKVAISFITHGYDQNVRLRTFPYMSNQKYEHLLSTVVHNVWRTIVKQVAEHSSNYLRQLTVSQVIIVRKQLICYKEWMLSEEIQVMKLICQYSVDINQNIPFPDIIKVLRLYKVILIRVKNKQKENYKKLAQKQFNSQLNHSSGIKPSINNNFSRQVKTYNSKQKYQEIGQRNFPYNRSNKEQTINPYQPKTPNLMLQSQYYPSMSKTSQQNFNQFKTYGKSQYHGSQVQSSQQAMFNNVFPYRKGQFQMSYYDPNADPQTNQNYNLPGMKFAKLKKQSRQQKKIIQEINSKPALSWKSVKSSTSNGIPRIQSFKGGSKKLRKGQDLMVMEYDDDKSVEDFDDVVRNTEEQGSLASYSKTYRKREKKVTDQGMKVKGFGKQSCVNVNVTKQGTNNKKEPLITINPSTEEQTSSPLVQISGPTNKSGKQSQTKLQEFLSPPSEQYWTEDKIWQFFRFYIQKPSLNSVKDAFNQLEQHNNLYFDYKLIKSKYGKLMRIAIRDMITKRQEVELQCQKQGISCRMPPIYKLKDDKVKVIMSTPPAQQTRIQIMKLYLTERQNIQVLQQTIQVVNAFVEKMFGFLAEFEPVVPSGAYAVDYYVDDRKKEENTNGNIHVKKPIDIVNQEYQQYVHSSRVKNRNDINYNDAELPLNQVDHLIKTESKKLYQSRKL